MMKHRDELELMEAKLKSERDRALINNNIGEFIILSEKIYKVKQDIETLKNESELAYQ